MPGIWPHADPEPTMAMPVLTSIGMDSVRELIETAGTQLSESSAAAPARLSRMPR